MLQYLLIRRAKELILKSQFWHLLHLRMRMHMLKLRLRLQRHPIHYSYFSYELVWLICLIRKP